MGRPIRPLDDGRVDQAIHRGNDRRVVFADDEDHRAFLQSLARTRPRDPSRIEGDCLMSNYLLLRTGPGATISRIRQPPTVAHTWRFHRGHRSVGHARRGRSRGPVVRDDSHLRAVHRSSRPIRSAPGRSPTRPTTPGRAARPTAEGSPTPS